MDNAITFKGRSDKFGDNVLIWEKQLGLLMQTNQPTIFWQVQEGPVMEFTVQSILQAFLKRKFVASNRKTDGKKFYIVSYSDLVQV